MTIKCEIYDYAIEYLKIHGDSKPCEIAKSFLRTHPDVTKDDKNTRTVLTNKVTQEIRYYGDRAPIIRVRRGVFRYNGE